MYNHIQMNRNSDVILQKDDFKKHVMVSMIFLALPFFRTGIFSAKRSDSRNASRLGRSVERRRRFSTENFRRRRGDEGEVRARRRAVYNASTRRGKRPTERSDETLAVGKIRRVGRGVATRVSRR